FFFSSRRRHTRSKRDWSSDVCSSDLADTYTLYLMTHNFHWNVTGPMFNTLHNMFMDQYTEAWQALDKIAERIRALGHFAPGTYRSEERRVGKEWGSQWWW